MGRIRGYGLKRLLYLVLLGLALTTISKAEPPKDGTPAPAPDAEQKAPRSWWSLPSLTQDESADRLRQTFDAEGSKWRASQKEHLLTNFIKNSDGSYSGAVLASPSGGRPPEGEDPGEPDYRFHWIRDSGIAAESVAYMRMSPASTSEEKKQYSTVLRAFVDFSRKVQQTPIKHEWMVFDEKGAGFFVDEKHHGAIPVRYGEPKYRVIEVTHEDGRKTWEPAAFDEPWGRPQNDGPALRAVAVIQAYAGFQLDRKDVLKANQAVPEEVTKAMETSLAVLKHDLDFLKGRWGDPSYDAWEEVYGDHFFTRAVQAEALLEGARLMERQGLPGAEPYRNAGLQAAASLDHFFQDGYIKSSINIKGGMRKDSDLDMLVIMAALRRKRGRFSVSDPKVQATAAKLHDDFKNDPAFTMNRIEGIPGTAYGRYRKDPWTGERRLQNEDGSPKSAGHPWIITTMAMGEMFYRVANENAKAGELEVNTFNRRFYEIVMNGAFPEEWAQQLEKHPDSSLKINAKTHPELFSKIQKKLEHRGNEIGARILASGIDANGFTSEQFSGDPDAPVVSIGAVGLTWNCAAFSRLSQAYQKTTGRIPATLPTN